MTTPLFAHLAALAKPLSSVLPAQAMPPATSPWTPQDNDANSQRAFADAKRQAIEAGRAEGLRETEALRGKLASMIAELELARAAAAERDADAISDAAVTVVEAFIGATDRTALFAPIVKGWLARNGGPATARVNPLDVATLCSVIGEAAITVESDTAIAAGDITIRGTALDTSHLWRERLRELRDVIAAALETQP